MHNTTNSCWLCKTKIAVSIVWIRINYQTRSISLKTLGEYTYRAVSIFEKRKLMIYTIIINAYTVVKSIFLYDSQRQNVRVEDIPKTPMQGLTCFIPHISFSRGIASAPRIGWRAARKPYRNKSFIVGNEDRCSPAANNLHPWMSMVKSLSHQRQRQKRFDGLKRALYSCRWSISYPFLLYRVG